MSISFFLSLIVMPSDVGIFILAQEKPVIITGFFLEIINEKNTIYTHLSVQINYNIFLLEFTVSFDVNTCAI